MDVDGVLGDVDQKDKGEGKVDLMGVGMKGINGLIKGDKF